MARREWPASDVDGIDEAHILHEAEKARIKVSGGITLGLTATPFTKGLSNYFQAFVNVATTHGLIEAGFLSPYRIFACAKPDMEGVRVKSSGEWDEKESSSRALEVVGDVVAEYIKHGEDRKFICSGVDTAHVMSQRQFLWDQRRVLHLQGSRRRSGGCREGVRKLDSQIEVDYRHGARGFDVPSVSCIIMARPLKVWPSTSSSSAAACVSEGKVNCLVLCHPGMPSASSPRRRLTSSAPRCAPEEGGEEGGRKEGRACDLPPTAGASQAETTMPGCGTSTEEAVTAPQVRSRS